MALRKTMVEIHVADGWPRAASACAATTCQVRCLGRQAAMGCLRCSIAYGQGRRPLSNALGTMPATRMGGQAGGRVMLTISEAGRRPWRVMIVDAEDRALTITGVRADEHWVRRMRTTTNGNGLPWARSQPMSALDSARTQVVSSVSRPFPSRAPPTPTNTR